MSGTGWSPTGATSGCGRAGYYAINALRLDKGYRAFGPELGPDRTPVEAGLTFTCDLSGDRAFVGRGGGRAQRRDGPPRRLASFVVDDPQAVLWGGELLLRDGRPVGQVTSAAPSATLGAAVGLTWVWERGGGPVPREVLTAGGYAVDVAGSRHSVRLSARSPHDPGELARALLSGVRTGLEFPHGSRGRPSWCPKTGQRDE